MRREGSFEDFTAAATGGVISVLTIALLGYIVSADQSTREDLRENAIEQHKTMLETRTILHSKVKDDYTLRAFLIDAAEQQRTEAGIKELKEKLRSVSDTWYWSYNGREGTIPPNNRPPEINAEPMKLPTETGTTKVLFYRYEE